MLHQVHMKSVTGSCKSFWTTLFPLFMVLWQAVLEARHLFACCNCYFVLLALATNFGCLGGSAGKVWKVRENVLNNCLNSFGVFGPSHLA